MVSAVSFINFALGRFSADHITKHINNYIIARDAFNRAGGQAFINDRREVRAAYCNATVSSGTLEKWIANLPNEAVQNEFTRRFQEWNAKIAKGIGGIAKSGPQPFQKDNFLRNSRLIITNMRAF